MRKLILFFLIIFLTIGILGFYYYQRQIFSKEVLKLEIFGKTEAELAEEIEYLVKYKNNGNTRLEEPKLIFEYPKNSIVEGDVLRVEKSLEDIYPGEEKTLNFKARLFGGEGEAKVASAWLSYRPKNLQARFEAVTTFTTIIKTIPLTFEFDLPSRTESGEEIKLRLNYYSNLNYPLSNLRIKVNYPTGFEFLESKPKALEKIEWEIGILNRAEGGRIEISGILKGEVGESKVFQAELGSWQEGEFLSLKKTFRGIEITKPSFYIFQQINRNPQYIGNAGDLLNYEIFFKNIGQEIAENLFLTVQLEGETFDFDSARIELGQFNKEEKKIFWDYARVPELRRLLPMEEGKVKFWIKLKDEFPSEIRNPAIKNIVSLDGLREEFENKINSKLEIFQKGYFQDEIFGNSGPIPPRVGETTTYTIIWQVKNNYNNVKNIRVRVNLPNYIRLTGEIFPKEAKFLFDSESREILWEVGDLEAGQGQTLAFQIALAPTSDQKGQTPEIIGEAKITGEDTWTEATLEKTSLLINTTLPDDPTMRPEMGIVQ